MPVKCIGWLWRARAMLSSNCFVILSVVVVSYATIARSSASVAAQPVTPTASMATVSGARVSRLPARQIRLHIGPTTTSLIGIRIVSSVVLHEGCCHCLDIIVTDEELHRAKMVNQAFGERQGFAHRTGNPLPHRGRMKR